jgi:hypothetical protein
VWSAHKRIEGLRYMHRNTVKRGLVLERGRRWPSENQSVARARPENPARSLEGSSTRAGSRVGNAYPFAKNRERMGHPEFMPASKRWATRRKSSTTMSSAIASS